MRFKNIEEELEKISLIDQIRKECSNPLNKDPFFEKIMMFEELDA